MSDAKIAIIGGTGLEDPKFFKKIKDVKIKTPYGFPSAPIEIGDFSVPEGKHPASYGASRKIAFLARHGKRNEIPPHRVNYQANIFALKKLGVKYIFAFNSVGSLKKRIQPGSFLVPSDYIDFNPPTFFDKNSKFITPKISENLRKVFIKILKKLKLKFWPKGVYFNSKGPRLETKAEINLIKNYADVVGMTMAKEATLAQELGIEYTALCSVDNYAQGIGSKVLDLNRIEEGQKKNSKIIEKIMLEILKSHIS